MEFIFAIPGLLRTIGCALVSAGPVVEAIPVPSIAMWGPVLTQVGTAICGIGIARAGIRALK